MSHPHRPSRVFQTESTMNMHKIPEITLQKINNINKKFLWIAYNNTKRKSYINWNTICKLKNYWGMGFRNLHLVNKSFLLKLTWRLVSDKQSLRAKTIKGKYFPNSNIWNLIEHKAYHNISWKNIYKMTKILREACLWTIGNGNNINFWYDLWVDKIRIADYVKNIPPELDKPVCC